MPLQQIEGEFYSDPRAEWMPYMRGFVYLLLVDTSLRQASTISYLQDPIDEVVMSITRRNRTGELTNSTTWLEILYPLLGKECVDKQYHTLINGGALQLDLKWQFTVGEQSFKLQPIRQEVFELGFSPKSLRTGLLTDVKAGSRAELAGLRNGDEIHCTGVSRSLLKFNREISFIVSRPGQSQLVKGKFWPRSFKKIESFQVVRI